MCCSHPAPIVASPGIRQPHHSLWREWVGCLTADSSGGVLPYRWSGKWTYLDAQVNGVDFPNGNFANLTMWQLDTLTTWHFDNLLLEWFCHTLPSAFHLTLDCAHCTDLTIDFLKVNKLLVWIENESVRVLVGLVLYERKRNLKIFKTKVS